jgi:hypothetical protein
VREGLIVCDTSKMSWLKPELICRATGGGGGKSTANNLEFLKFYIVFHIIFVLKNGMLKSELYIAEFSFERALVGRKLYVTFHCNT